MEFREDLMYSISEYGGVSHGLSTLGEFKTIELENGKKIELLPYILDTHCMRGTSKDDPRRRMNNDIAISKLSQAYADHYKSIGEEWTKERVEDLLHWQLGQSFGSFFFVKWARDLDSGEEFPIGFFCAYTKPYHAGKMLWDGELFVLPEYRKYGIGTELTEAVFTMAKTYGINFIDSLTYEDENGYPYKFWEKLGVTRDDLIHIFGEIDTVLTNIQSKGKTL